MELLGIGLLALVFVGILVYYIRKGINAERNEQAVQAQSDAREAALAQEEALLAEREREDRRSEAAEVTGVTRERANELLRDAFKDDFN